MRIRVSLLFCVALGVAAEAGPAAPPPDDTSGIPDPVIQLVRYHYPQDTQADHGSREYYYKAFRPVLATWPAVWKAYGARKQVVDAAVAHAAELAKAGDRAGARAALQAVITTIAPDDRGRIDPKKRASLEPRDAEVPAIDAYVQLLVADHDYKAAIEAGALYWTRRKAKDETTEMWYWLAAGADTPLGKLVSDSGGGIAAEIDKVYDAAAHARGANPYAPEGAMLADQADKRLFHEGLMWTVVDVEKGKAGDYVMIQLSPTKVGGKSIDYAGTEQWREPKDCHKTNRIETWDGNGDPIYAEECDYDYFDRKITLHADLAEPLPDWAKGRDTISIIGRIVKPGPAWKISGAVVPDLRYRETDF